MRAPNFVIKLWYGDYSLPKAFWGFFFFGQGVIAAAGALINALMRSVGLHGLGFGIAVLILYAYLAFVSVGVWRSASKYGAYRPWALLAKLYMFCWIIKLCLAFEAHGGANALFERMTSSS
ncbi:MAG: hypothetical protein M3N08_04380 [Pseudomonadota bacterium]|nr:hypothetical protein [Pseudomonadota bacterium]